MRHEARTLSLAPLLGDCVPAPWTEALSTMPFSSRRQLLAGAARADRVLDPGGAASTGEPAPHGPPSEEVSSAWGCLLICDPYFF